MAFHGGFARDNANFAVIFLASRYRSLKKTIVKTRAMIARDIIC
jgi:hypothetical protein